MSTAEVAIPDEPDEGRGHTDDAGGPELRRWRLVARLAELRHTAQTDLDAFAAATADLLAEELGDLAEVVIVDSRDAGHPIAALAHHDPARAAILDWLRVQTTAERVHQLVEFMGSDPGVITGIPPAGERGTYQVYNHEIGIDASAYAALRHGRVLLGGISCTRDRGSGRFSASDLSAIAAAADTVSLLLDAAVARREVATAAQREIATFEAAPIGMGNVDPSGTITAINHVGCLILGRLKSEIVGRSWRDFAHPDDLESDEQFIADANMGAIDTGRGTTRRVVRQDGSVRWIRVTSQPLRDASAALVGFHTQFVDVTNQFLAEAEADRLATLVHSSPDFVAISTLDGQIAFVNAAGRALVGLSDSFDVTAATTFDFIVDDEHGHAEFEAMAHGVTWEGDSNLRDWRDGGTIPVRATSYVIRDLHTGHATAIATIRRDIRDQLADQLELERRAEQRRRLLAELVSAEQNERRRIAEDLHDESIQLLAAGQLRLQLLARQIETGDIGAARGSAHDISDLVITALQRLRDVLIDLEPPTGPGHAIHDSVRDAAQRLFAGSDIVVDVSGELDEAGPETAAVLYRATREALSNARRHAAPTTVCVRMEESADVWAITIEDDGVGMPVDVPFRRGHLGLSGMTSRIEALGGRATVGRPDKGGTRVELVVPRSGH